MKTSLEQQVSEMVDGELDASRREHLLRQMKKDQRLLQTWNRYHLISNALKSNLPDFIGNDMAMRVSKAIEAEPALLVPSSAPVESISSPQPEKPHVSKRLPLAIAASVAAAAAVGLTLTQFEQATTIASAPPTQSADESRLAQQGAPLLTNEAAWEKPRAENQVAQNLNGPRVANESWLRIDTTGKSELNTYLFDHSEYSASAGMRGLFPYARVVSYEVNGSK